MYLGAGDFVLLLASDGLAVANRVPPVAGHADESVEVHPGVFHLGTMTQPDTRILIGCCTFGADEADPLVSFLPSLVVVRAERRLTKLVELVSDEAGAERPGCEAVLARLLEVLLIGAFRNGAGPNNTRAECAA